MIRKLQASKRSISAEAFREKVEAARIQTVVFETKFPFLETSIAKELAAHEAEPQSEAADQRIEPALRVVPVSLFG